jgi:amidase
MLDRPSPAQIFELAGRFKIPIDESETTQYEELAEFIIGIIDGLESLAPATGHVDNVRDAGRAATREEDPLNAIARWCSVGGGGTGILSGRRIAVKDSVAIAGLPMRAGSRVLDGFVPSYDSTVTKRILDAGGQIVATTNMDDLAFSAGGETSYYGAVRNPFDSSRSAGGSSGGSAAALHYDGIDLAIGGDQGGSIRIPASWSGVLGLKPTHDLVPYTGILGVDRTFNHVGPLARTAEGIARLLQAIAGADEFTVPGQPEPADYIDSVAMAPASLEGVTIGVLREGFADHVDPEVAAAVRTVADEFRRLGATLTDVSVPEHLAAGAASFTCFVEGWFDTFSSGGTGYQHFGQYCEEVAAAMTDGIRRYGRDLAPTVKIAAVVGGFLRERYGGRYYARAHSVRRELRAAYDQRLNGIDAFLLPTTPYVAFELKPEALLTEHVKRGWDMMSNTHMFDMTGHPALSIPAASVSGLPVGVQLVGGHFSEDLLLRIAAVYERKCGWQPMDNPALVGI